MYKEYLDSKCELFRRSDEFPPCFTPCFFFLGADTPPHPIPQPSYPDTILGSSCLKFSPIYLARMMLGADQVVDEKQRATVTVKDTNSRADMRTDGSFRLFSLDIIYSSFSTY